MFFSLKIALLHGDLDPHLIHGFRFLSPSEPITQMASRSVESFLQCSWHTTIPNTWFLGCIRVLNPTGISIGSAIFAELMAVCRRACPGMSLAIKTAHSYGAIWTSSNTWFLGRTESSNPNGISIGSAVFAGLTTVTDRLTDHTTRSVTIGRIYIRSTGIPHNNNSCLTALVFQSYSRLCKAPQYNHWK